MTVKSRLQIKTVPQIFQSKAVAPYELDYVPSLDTETMLLAETELRETEAVRTSALAAMRHWMDSNPSILKCRYDAPFLLQFLRFRKFSVPMATRALERYLANESSYFGYPLSWDEDNVADLLNRGCIFGLPERDSLGRMVVLMRLSVIDVHKHRFIDWVRLTGMCSFAASEKEEHQIRGFVYIIDFSGISTKHLLWAEHSQLPKLFTLGQVPEVQDEGDVA